ncbi:hypothetical protein ACFLYO_07065 [Chloroflexota bacterium]
MTPPEHPTRLQRAQQLLDQGALDDALALLYSLVAVEPENGTAWWLIAQHSPYARPKQQALQRVLEIAPQYLPAQTMAIQMGMLEAPPAPDLSELELPTGAFTGQAQPDAPPPPVSSPPPLSSPPAADYPAPLAAVPEGVPEEIPVATPLPAMPPPAPAPPPAQPAYQPPASPPPAPPASQPPPPRTYEPIQPFLVINGGCSSGCFALVLTFLAMAALLLLLVWGSTNTALHNIAALDQSQSIPTELIPAVALTGILAFMQANVTTLPFNLESNLANFGITVPTNDELYSATLRDLWTSLDYPAYAADAIMAEISRIGPRLTAAPWIPLVIFFFAWLIFAFLFVFLRARSRRFLHWGLSTFGLWLLFFGAVGIALLLFNIWGGA